MKGKVHAPVWLCIISSASHCLCRSEALIVSWVLYCLEPSLLERQDGKWFSFKNENAFSLLRVFRMAFAVISVYPGKVLDLGGSYFRIKSASHFTSVVNCAVNISVTHEVGKYLDNLQRGRFCVTVTSSGVESMGTNGWGWFRHCTEHQMQCKACYWRWSLGVPEYRLGWD